MTIIGKLYQKYLLFIEQYAKITDCALDTMQMRYNNEMKNRLIIIGAGAAGLVAAITSARAGQSVLLLEQNSKIGKKILVSGNGKCNIGNRYIDPSRFHSQNPDFVKAALESYDFAVIEKLDPPIGKIGSLKVLFLVKPIV